MIAYFAKHPTAANLLMVVFLAAGLLSIGKLRRETFPDFRPTEVEIRVLHPGATAEEVEESVCQRLEDALDGVRFVEELRSDARQGLGIVTIAMLPGGSYQAFKDEVDTAVEAIDEFPSGAEEPIITGNLQSAWHLTRLFEAFRYGEEGQAIRLDSLRPPSDT